MAVCFFNTNYDLKYKCEYEIEESYIEVIVNYEIENELQSENGIINITADVSYDDRDILIIDHEIKKNILLKDAYYAGHSTVLGSPDGGAYTKFRAHVYFEHGEYNKLINLPSTPKVKKIKVFSKAINYLIGCPSLKMDDSDDCLAVALSKKDNSKCIDVNQNYIRNIRIGDSWKSVFSHKEYNLKIDITGFIELELTKKINYDVISQFIFELILYMQLYRPDKFIIDEVKVQVDNTFYSFNCFINIPKENGKNIEKSVQDDLLTFLKNCYTSIPYRKSKEEFRNIPYIVLKSSRSIEDNFLMFYRFIECYYKKQPIPNIRKTFISYSLMEKYSKHKVLSEEEIDRYAHEIISLRNHYTHAGYFIKNNSLKVSFDKVNRKKNPKDYTATNVDGIWVYERTKMFYDIVIEIIFNDMLGYEQNEFRRHF